MNLLLVEDDSLFRDYLRLRVAKAACREAPNVFEAATLTDALGILHSEHIDGILSDGVFPPDCGNGMVDLCQWAESWRALYQECKERGVPFVLLSGYPAIVESAHALGQTAFSKPYDMRIAIKQLLNLASARPRASAR